MCGCCNRIFPAYCSVRRHCQRIHGLDREEVACSICGIPLLSYRDLLAHAKAVHNQSIQKKSAICGLCPESPTDIREIWNHIRIRHLNQHSNETECPLCQAILPKKDWKAHVSDLHPIINCYKCDETFGSYSAYSRHFTEIHVDPGRACGQEKVIVCGICLQRYRHNDHFATHVYKVHLKQIPTNYQLCMYCLQTFPLTEIKVHVNSRHEQVQCLICMKLCSRKSYGSHLDSHFR